MLDKVHTTLDQSIADIPDGATVMIGGFGEVGALPHGNGVAVGHGPRSLLQPQLPRSTWTIVDDELAAQPLADF